jgi:hypothetical protein
MPAVIREILGAPPRRDLQVLRERLGDAAEQLFGDPLHARVGRDEDAEPLLAALRSHGIGEASARVIVPTLEDVFIELVRGASEVV